MSPEVVFGLAAAVVATILVVFAAARAFKAFRPVLFPYDRFLTRIVVPEGTASVLYTDGRFDRVLPPGPLVVGPRQRVDSVPLGERTSELVAQELLTADRFTIKLSATLVSRIVDPHRYLTAAQTVDHRGVVASASMQAVERDARLALRNIAAARTLEALLADRTASDAELAAALAGAEAAYGIRVDRAVVRDILLPPEVRRAYTEAERVRLEALAALERARGEQAALRSLANAARMLKNSPELMNLRVLQTVEGIDPRKRLTVVLGEGVMAPVGTGPAATEDL